MFNGSSIYVYSWKCRGNYQLYDFAGICPVERRVNTRRHKHTDGVHRRYLDTHRFEKKYADINSVSSPEFINELIDDDN